MGLTTPDKENRLQKLREKIAQQQHPLALSANLVMGRGSLNSPLVLIGEAPGAEEDVQQQPFVGKSGQMLNRMLSTAKLNNCYITNIVKYRPPKNRDPQKSEISFFLPHLKEELLIIGATHIATLGRHALSCFFPKAKVSSCHGQWIQLENWACCRQLMPLYHPAATLYDPRLQPVLQRDLLSLASTLSADSLDAAS
jgi:uracil-DNA glycosylase family 4